MMGLREVRAERLDDLPPDDPAAQASRRDLVRINALMGNARLMAGMLAGRPLASVLEIGAGAGDSMLRVARRLDRPDVKLTLLDQQDLLTEPRRTAYARLGWHVEAVQTDVFDYLQRETGRFDAIVANLFLHHFEDDPLRELLRRAAERTDLFAACEPARSSLGLLGCALMPILRFHEVTHHDGRVSVLAGFRDGELSALWPGDGWDVEERAVAPFGHTFRAVRR